MGWSSYIKGLTDSSWLDRYRPKNTREVTIFTEASERQGATKRSRPSGRVNVPCLARERTSTCDTYAACGPRPHEVSRYIEVVATPMPAFERQLKRDASPPGHLPIESIAMFVTPAGIVGYYQPEGRSRHRRWPSSAPPGAA